MHLPPPPLRRATRSTIQSSVCTAFCLISFPSCTACASSYRASGGVSGGSTPGFPAPQVSRQHLMAMQQCSPIAMRGPGAALRPCGGGAVRFSRPHALVRPQRSVERTRQAAEAARWRAAGGGCRAALARLPPACRRSPPLLLWGAASCHAAACLQCGSVSAVIEGPGPGFACPHCSAHRLLPPSPCCCLAAFPCAAADGDSGSAAAASSAPSGSGAAEEPETVYYVSDAFAVSHL